MKKDGVFIPKGISYIYSGGWVLSSAAYRERTKYRFINYGRISKAEAVRRFVDTFGTDEQKAEYRRATGG